VAAANKPTSQHCVNVSNGKTSHLLLKAHGLNFPIARFVDVYDVNNDFPFNGTIIPQVDPQRLALKIVSNLPGGGGAPTDGLLTITLYVPGLGGQLNPVQVADCPVDYIDDPGGP
jgi:hypothetical protein